MLTKLSNSKRAIGIPLTHGWREYPIETSLPFLLTYYVVTCIVSVDPLLVNAAFPGFFLHVLPYELTHNPP